MDVTMEGSTDAAAGAVAAACVANNNGLFKVAPTEYRVRCDGLFVPLTLKFDWESESWSAEARETEILP